MQSMSEVIFIGVIISRAYENSHGRTSVYVCKVCLKTFTYNSSLPYHMKIHTDVKNVVYMQNLSEVIYIQTFLKYTHENTRR